MIMSEVFSNFLGNIVLSITNVLFFRIISKNKIVKNKKYLTVSYYYNLNARWKLLQDYFVTKIKRKLEKKWKKIDL